MKKLGLFLLAGALTLGLTACGGSDEASKSEDTSADTTTTQQDEGTTAATTSTDAQEFTITAKNWEFSADKELTVKKGTTVKLNLVNAEGVHTILNDDFGINLTADAPAEFTADKTGEFELKCNQICGAMKDHEGMKITLKVVD
ncbi:cupredoxin domain-containing protein [Neobacillus sp. D3-1R]|uniref:cupredoxin domain-containing protein n=1 Tax=Neobacillus sp. D3-1R TaxID=3445778 RepID=UPI003FA06CEA